MQIKKIERIVCAACGSPEVSLEVLARWSIEEQKAVVDTIFDKGHTCDYCDGDCGIERQDGLALHVTEVAGAHGLRALAGLLHDAMDCELIVIEDSVSVTSGGRCVDMCLTIFPKAEEKTCASDA